VIVARRWMTSLAANVHRIPALIVANAAMTVLAAVKLNNTFSSTQKSAINLAFFCLNLKNMLYLYYDL